MSETNGGAERRVHERTPVLFHASLSGDDRVVECLVLNMSLGGSKVEIKDPSGSWSKVRLGIPGLYTFNGDVVWQSGTELGIQFADEYPPDATAL